MNFYLQKYGFQKPELKAPPLSNTGIIVVIPCFNEPDIITSLNALNKAEKPNSTVEIIIVINHAENHSEEIKTKNIQTLTAIETWKNKTELNVDFHVIKAFDLPIKHAGVGLARKIGMDEAVFRFDKVNQDGVIVCFDADSTCDVNYFKAIENHFNKHTKSPGAAIKFAHPIEGNDFNSKNYEGIIYYELFLRYYNQGLKYAKLPFAFHTVGSSMAVRSSAYQKQGGMNKRKAGEDFYFLHKIISLGNFTEINATTVSPSPRISDRVPFGTGKAINDWMDKEEDNYLTYDARIWQILKDFTACIPILFQTTFDKIEFYNDHNNRHFIRFLKANNFEDDLLEIKSNSTDQQSFTKRFFVWFNAFRVLKLVHFLRDEQFPNQPIFEQAKIMAEKRGFYRKENSTKDLLISYRKFEAKNHL